MTEDIKTYEDKAMVIREVTEPIEKQRITRLILEALPDWFEVFPLLWDENNPCQIYVMSLK